MYINFYLLHDEPCNVDVANKPLLLLLLKFVFFLKIRLIF